MAGYGYDTSTLTIRVTLPDGACVEVVGNNDGVNGYEWSATLNEIHGEKAAPENLIRTPLDVEVEDAVLIDGINDPEDDERDWGAEGVHWSGRPGEEIQRLDVPEDRYVVHGERGASFHIVDLKGERVPAEFGTFTILAAAEAKARELNDENPVNTFPGDMHAALHVARNGYPFVRYEEYDDDEAPKWIVTAFDDEVEATEIPLPEPSYAFVIDGRKYDEADLPHAPDENGYRAPENALYVHPSQGGSA